MRTEEVLLTFLSNIAGVQGLLESWGVILIFAVQRAPVWLNFTRPLREFDCKDEIHLF